MVEVPSAALLADQLATRVDFMSIGTNDLTQYLLAADRTNAALAGRQDGLHPAVLRALRAVVEAGQRHGIRVGICGEMAGEPLYAVLLVGLGLVDFSVSPYLVPEIKTILHACNSNEAAALVKDCFALGTPSEVRAVVTEFMHRRFPEHFLA